LSGEPLLFCANYSGKSKVLGPLAAPTGRSGDFLGNFGSLAGLAYFRIVRGWLSYQAAHNECFQEPLPTFYRSSAYKGFPANVPCRNNAHTLLYNLCTGLPQDCYNQKCDTQCCPSLLVLSLTQFFITGYCYCMNYIIAHLKVNRLIVGFLDN
jgi:hypothetical protein